MARCFSYQLLQLLPQDVVQFVQVVEPLQCAFIAMVCMQGLHGRGQCVQMQVRRLDGFERRQSGVECVAFFGQPGAKTALVMV